MKKRVSYGKILNLHMFSHDRKPVFFVAQSLVEMVIYQMFFRNDYQNPSKCFEYFRKKYK